MPGSVMPSSDHPPPLLRKNSTCSSGPAGVGAGEVVAAADQPGTAGADVLVVEGGAAVRPTLGGLHIGEAGAEIGLGGPVDLSLPAGDVLSIDAGGVGPPVWRGRRRRCSRAAAPSTPPRSTERRDAPDRAWQSGERKEEGRDGVDGTGTHTRLLGEEGSRKVVRRTSHHAHRTQRRLSPCRVDTLSQSRRVAAKPDGSGRGRPAVSSTKARSVPRIVVAASSVMSRPPSAHAP